MNGQAKAAFALIAALVVCGFGTIVAPRLESAPRRAEREADRYVEKARRLLAAYHPALDFTSLMVADLSSSNVDVMLKGEGDLIGEERFQALYGEELEALLGRFDPTGQYQPQGGTEGQIRAGLSLQEGVLADNAKVLKEALNTVQEALAVEVGGATASAHPAANRLKGVILYHQARQEARRSALLRAAINRPLSELASLADKVRQAQPETTLLASTKIDEQIAEMRRQIDSAEQTQAALAAESKAIKTRISDLEGRLAKAKAEADQARAGIESLMREGQDFSRQDAFEAFKAEFERYSAAYGQALKAAHEAEFGVYPGAGVEPPGDYLDGALVQNGVRTNLNPSLGLAHYRNALQQTTAALELAEGTLMELSHHSARLAGDKITLAEQSASANQTVAALKSSAADTAERLVELDQKAWQVEQSAISLFRESARAFDAAHRASVERLSAAAEKARAVSPSVSEFSAYTHMSEAAPSVYHLRTEQAESLAGEAWLLQQAYVSARDQERVLSSTATVLGLSPDVVNTAKEAVATRLDTGRQATQKAAEILQGVHGQLGGHWTVTAAYAGTSYLFVLFGDHGLVAEVRENYRSALNGRDDVLQTLPLKERLEYLEGR